MRSDNGTQSLKNIVTSDNSSTKMLLVAILSSRDNASTPDAVSSAETRNITSHVVAVW